MFYHIGNYLNNEGCMYCTVIVMASSIFEAKAIQEQEFDSNPNFQKVYIGEITQQEIDDITNQNDIWNQIDIIK